MTFEQQKGTTMHLNKLLFIMRNEKGRIENSDILLLKAMHLLFDYVSVYLCGDFSLKETENVIGNFCNYAKNREYTYTDFEILKEEVFHLSDKNEIDELVIADNSVFGPLYELTPIVNIMRKKNYDFWGLTKMGEVISDTWEIFPEHLQMYFWSIEKRLLHSQELQEFFRQRECCFKFEEEFTAFFEQNGYSWGVYADIPRYNSDSVTNNINLLYEVSYELISKHNFPFLKKDYFIHKDLCNSTNSDLHKAFDFINTKKLYDCDLIWDFLLKNYNIVQIKDSLNLHYILPVEQTEQALKIDNEDYQNTIIIMHIAYDESVDDIQEYISVIPKQIKKIFVVISKAAKQYLEKKLLGTQCKNYEIRIMEPNRGRDMNSLFVVCRDVWKKYRYLCFSHDKRTSGDTGSFLIGKEFMNVLWENTLKSHGYILEILSLLKREKRLGYLTVPAPYHSFYYETVAKAWAKSYEATRDLAEKLGLDVDISDQYQPFALGNAFWCKTDALRDIVNYQLETNDFSDEPMPRDGTISHALERIMIFAAQNAGYYSGIIENAEYAGRELNNKNYMWEKLLEKILIKPQFCNTGTFPRLTRLLYNSSFEKFLKEKKDIYIWGAGKTGKGLNRELMKRGYVIKGYICSSEFPKPQNCDNNVYYLSEIEYDNSNIGIILAVHKKFYKELYPVLEKLKDQIYYL